MSKPRVLPRPAHPERPKNLLLRALPDDVFERLRPDLRTIVTKAKQTFYRRGTAIDHVYFPNGGVASLTAVLADGTLVETAIVGREGMLGIEAFLGEDSVSPGDAMLQVPDTSAERISVVAFRRELARQGEFADLMGRYAQASIAHTMQSVACNARHPIQQRCARWLLGAHDRVDADDFSLSHEFLAVMLGVRRQSVTVVGGTLQEAGLISYRRGHVTILNRKRLESASCECHAVVRRKYKSLLG
jgi:CRP-like cAMP-binding protein